MSKPPEIIDQFERAMHGVQAMRRYVERLACPIQGGSGIRAHFYPHQIQNVQRILSATRIRHLIADEVGMGKTIQALMVASAMRLQREHLRVRVIVGRSELQSQWSEEVCRSHVVIWDKSESVFGETWFEVVTESSIDSLANTFSANAFDLLIIDEPQSLKVETLRFIAEHSEEFASLLLLTASPNLSNAERFCELLQILEPQRIERARREIDRDPFHDEVTWSKSRLRDLEEAELLEIFDRFDQSCAAVTDGIIDPDFVPEGASAAFSEIAIHRRSRMLTDLSWRYRRVLRSYREDYPDHLPRRHPRSFDQIEPTESETRRVSLAIRYAEDQFRLDTERASVFLRRASVGSESFQSQLRTLRQNEDRGTSQIEELLKVTSRANADARLDFLVDWLVRFWRDDPTREVLVAAQDNATVEELEREIEWRIPMIGPRDHRRPLRIATARDSFSASSEIEDDSPRTSEALRSMASSQLREFKMGGKQLLIATDSFRQSYNLQSADALIFYSLPWRPEDVDQWIGRVDRLGRGFVAPEVRKSPPKPVKIVTIHRNGDPTKSVEQVFNEYRVLESAVDMDRELADDISTRISSEIWSRDTALEKPPAITRKVREVQPPSGSIWSVSNAISVHSEIAFGDALEPQLRHTKPLGFVSNQQEQCLASWIKLLEQHQQAAAWKVSKKYTDGSRRGAIYTLSQMDCVGISLPSLEDRSQSFPAFFLARRNVYSPPRLRVVTGKKEGQDREVLLQFLSHGSSLHEELIQTYRDDGRVTTPLGITLFAIGPRHFPNGTSLIPGNYPVGVGFIDAAYAYQRVSPTSLIAEAFSDETGSRRKQMRANQAIQFQAGIEADQRFIRMVASTKSCCLAFFSDGKPCSERDAADLMTANWSRDERPNTNNNPVAPKLHEGLPPHFKAAIAAELKRFWGQSMDELTELVAERIEMIRVEAFDVAWNLQAAINEANRQIEQLQSAPSEQNKQTIQLTYLPRVSMLREALQISEHACRLRCDLLEKSLEHLQHPSPTSVYLQAVAVVGMQNDPVPLPEEPDDDAEVSLMASEFATASPPQQESTIIDKPNKPR
ncbi:DEAD/DEAH box helicase [Allorhodopirellula heiligendammensis]|uniref:RNA polymerase-associated protein RapA n=1 Tax=Allorhodopirellula heiligendammensis TaxID=2714739 RepID=A0A5C6BGA6_9BACT|nr:DEAD/DEAH box helicase [Allorhodopirellula heiligendammensis]TWU10521.1 RNA polymerase-associated protein RapA [Allorhodopirellula heiligendammensis]